VTVSSPTIEAKGNLLSDVVLFLAAFGGLCLFIPALGSGVGFSALAGALVLWLGRYFAQAMKRAEASAAALAEANASAEASHRAALRPGILEAVPVGTQYSFKLIAGDVPTNNFFGYLYSDRLVMPVSPDEGLRTGHGLTLNPAKKYYQTYKLSQVDNLAVMAGGQPQSLFSVLGTGAAVGMLFNPLLALGAGAAVGARKDVEIVALEFFDGRRILCHMNTLGLSKLQFALGKAPVAASRQ
jgi:hypothetical protein